MPTNEITTKIVIMRQNIMKNKVTGGQTKFYSLGVVEANGVFKVVDSYVLQRVNQYKRDWQRVDSREVARNMNRGKLVIK